jgi:hypothetical protein
MPATSQEFQGTSRFQVLRRLGAGGMGVVYEALDRERRTRVALKTVRDLGGEDLIRLKNEFRALQDLQHPNLVSLGELCEEAGHWFFTMELIEGVSFLQHVRPGADPGTAETAQTDSNVSPSAATWRASPARKLWDASLPPSGTLDEGRLRDALGQLARGLAAAHAAGKVHRDVKPSNVLVTPAGRLVLLDFGLVTAVVHGEQSSALHAVGTIEYMAPEQAASQRVGPEADWYSVGVVLYEALTGHVPFTGGPLEVMPRKQSTAPVAPRTLGREVPADLDALCMALLQVDPRTRPTAGEVLTRLGLPTDATPAALAAAVGAAPPFVGREPELAALRDAYDASRAGAAVAVVIEGESGVGKSALLRRFSEELEARGVVVLAGRCYEREAVPYKAVDGVIDALGRYMSRIADDEAAALLPRAAALVASVFPVLRRVKAVAKAPRAAAEAPIDPQELRSRLFAALRELVAAADAWMAGERIRNPGRWAALLAPGFAT